MKIRKARLKDAKEIAKLRKDTFKNINSKDYPKEHIKIFNKKNSLKNTLIKIKEKDMFCIVEKNKILGTVYLDNDLIGGLYVKHNIIRQGIGTKLLKFIEDYARKKCIKNVKLFATKYGYPFYLKNKYRLIKKGFWTINNKKVIKYNMEKKL